MKFWIGIALMGMGVLAGALARAEPAQLARQLCDSCHGADGNGPGPAPRLAGQQAGYIEQQWQAFRLHQRADGGAHSAALAAMKGDGDIKALAAYFAAQPPAPARPAGGDPALLAAGRKLYAEGNLAVGTPPCFSCHGDRGEGGSAAPRLAGQHAAYLARRMRVSDAPQPDSAMEMQEILKTMSADDIKALLAYLATL
ncbi:c-type cytochrome [Chromobacterium sp. TRC.1.1.SA]|uniref:C-type cytochrome n=1 Tax=Chromobacterium indicum TaxID=3110228 RepID=A0ABV0CKH9_9NEIS